MELALMGRMRGDLITPLPREIQKSLWHSVAVWDLSDGLTG
jgi:hypothetical protein